MADKKKNFPTDRISQSKNILETTSPIGVVFQEIMSFALRNEFRGMLHEARERFFERPMQVNQRCSDRLERIFLEWAVFDYHNRRNAPTLFERFVKSRSFDKATQSSFEDLGKGRNGFFRVLHVESIPDGPVTISLVEMGRESDGRFDVALGSGVSVNEDSLIEGRLVLWNGSYCFLGGYRFFDAQLASEISADLRAIRQRYENEEHWRAVVADLKSMIACDLDAGRSISDLLRSMADGLPITPDKLVCAHIYSRLNARDVPTAIRWGEDALEDYPDSRTVRMVLANCYMSGERFQDALGLLEECISMEPDDVNGRLMAADCLIRLDRFSDARKVLEPAMEWKAIENYSLVLSRVGICHVNEGEIERGLRLMRESIADKPQSIDLYLANAAALMNTAQFQEILIYTEAGLEHDPHNQMLLFIQAYCFEQIKDYDKALSTLDRYVRSIRQQPDATFLKRTAMLAVRLGRFTRAIRAYENCLNTDRNDIEAAARLVEVLRMRGRDHQAEPIWQDLQRRNANHPDVLLLAQGKSLFAETDANSETSEHPVQV